MNVVMPKAFGATNEDHDAEHTDSKVQPGTTYEYTLFSDSTNSTASNWTGGNSTSVIEGEGAGAKVVVPWGALAVAGIVALI